MFRLSKKVDSLLQNASREVEKTHAEFFMPEHLFAEVIKDDEFLDIFTKLGGDVDILNRALEDVLDEVESAPKTDMSEGLEEVLMLATMDAAGRGTSTLEYTSLLVGLMKADMNDIPDIMSAAGVEADDFLEEVISNSAKKSTSTSTGTSRSEATGWKKHVKDFMQIAADRKEPLIGREKEIDDTVRILCRKEKSNPLHVGEPGVGKTAIALGLAKRIIEGNVPEKLKNKKIYALDASSLVAGTKFRGEMEEKVREVIEGAEKEGNIILYIDEIHTVIGAGTGSDGSMDLGNLLKQALLNGKISFIGATTYEEYRKHIQKDKAFERRFKLVDVVEPTMAETVEILKGIRPYYEEFHGVSYSDAVLEKAVELSVKYMHDRFLPDKAIDIIDEAGAVISKDLKIKPATKVIIDEKVIEDIIASTCKIPTATVKSSETGKLLNLEKDIKTVVFGQDEAIKTTVDAIKMSRAGLTLGTKPIASLLYVGPTGVGKTEVAKQLAENLDCELIRFDMSEYMDETSVNKLIGSSAGYVGYEDGGLLVEQIRKHPHAVLLLDEIEKAHPKVFNILLQVMDYASLTDNKGRKADFKNVVIIMTSNAGATATMRKSIGIGKELVSYDNAAMDSAVKATFSPEFRARLSKVVEFNPLSEDMGKKIVESHLKKLVDLLASKEITLKYTDNIVKYVEENGITKENGARQILRVIENDLKPLFVDGLISGDYVGKKVLLDIVDGKPSITKTIASRKKVEA